MPPSLTFQAPLTVNRITLLLQVALALKEHAVEPDLLLVFVRDGAMRIRIVPAGGAPIEERLVERLREIGGVQDVSVEGWPDLPADDSPLFRD